MGNNKKSREEFVTEFLPLLFQKRYVDLPNSRSNYIFYRQGDWVICDENTMEDEPTFPLPRRWKITDIDVILDFAYSVYDDSFEICPARPEEVRVPVKDQHWFNSPMTLSVEIEGLMRETDWVWFSPYLGFLMNDEEGIICAAEVREDRSVILNVVNPKYLKVFFHAGLLLSQMSKRYYELLDQQNTVASKDMLAKFEEKYEKTTEEFLKDYEKGVNPDTFDFNLWRSLSRNRA